MTLGSLRVFGIEIRVDASWIILALVIAWFLAAGVFPELYSDLPVLSYWGMAVATVGGIAASIVLHELGHTLAARFFGVRIRSITLFVFGGVASMENEPKTARAEFLIALMGPAVSVVLAIAFMAGAAAFKPSLTVEGYGVLHYLGTLNAALAVFNMAPAFPLDGGRVLRAAVWARTRDPVKATRIAARVGEAVALFIMGLGLIGALTGAVTGGLWWLLIGLYILLAARAHRVQAEAKLLLKGVRVEEVMTPKPVAASGAVSVEDFVRERLAQHLQHIIPVMEGEAVVGAATFKEARRLPRERWASTRLSDIAIPLEKLPTAAPQAAVTDALERMQQKGANHLLVMSGERLVGVLTLRDVLAQMELRAALSQAA